MSDKSSKLKLQKLKIRVLQSLTKLSAFFQCWNEFFTGDKNPKQEQLQIRHSFLFNYVIKTCSSENSSPKCFIILIFITRRHRNVLISHLIRFYSSYFKDVAVLRSDGEKRSETFAKSESSSKSHWGLFMRTCWALLRIFNGDGKHFNFYWFV